jgi:hypothetical protein
MGPRSQRDQSAPRLIESPSLWRSFTEEDRDEDADE